MLCEILWYSPTRQTPCNHKNRLSLVRWVLNGSKHVVIIRTTAGRHGGWGGGSAVRSSAIPSPIYGYVLINSSTARFHSPQTEQVCFFLIAFFTTDFGIKACFLAHESYTFQWIPHTITYSAQQHQQRDCVCSHRYKMTARETVTSKDFKLL